MRYGSLQGAAAAAAAGPAGAAPQGGQGVEYIKGCVCCCAQPSFAEHRIAVSTIRRTSAPASTGTVSVERRVEALRRTTSRNASARSRVESLLPRVERLRPTERRNVSRPVAFRRAAKRWNNVLRNASLEPRSNGNASRCDSLSHWGRLAPRLSLC